MENLKRLLAFLDLLIRVLIQTSSKAAKTKDGRWVYILILTIFFGFVSKTLILKLYWDWFLVPLGVSQVSVVHTAGILLGIYLIKSQIYEGQREILVRVQSIKKSVEPQQEGVLDIGIEEIGKAKLRDDVIIPWLVYALPGVILQFFI